MLQSPGQRGVVRRHGDRSDRRGDRAGLPVRLSERPDRRGEDPLAGRPTGDPAVGREFVRRRRVLPIAGVSAVPAAEARLLREGARRAEKRRPADHRQSGLQTRGRERAADAVVEVRAQQIGIHARRLREAASHPLPGVSEVRAQERGGAMGRHAAFRRRGRQAIPVRNGTFYTAGFPARFPSRERARTRGGRRIRRG